MKARKLNHKTTLVWAALLIVLSTWSFKSYSQYAIKTADVQFEHYNYHEAVKGYLKAWKKKQKPYIAQKLGDSYRKMNDYKAAEDWYGRLVGMAGSDPESRLWYAEALKSQGKYAEARSQYQQYIEQGAKAPGQVQRWIASCDSAMAWMAAPRNIKIEQESKLNSEGSDWGAVKYADGIVFTSDRTADQLNELAKNRPFLKFDGTKLPDRNIYRWTGSPYTHLYYSHGDQMSLFPLGKDNTYHTGAVSFTADGKEAYFTMTSTRDRKDFKQTINTVYVGLYSSSLSDGKWSDPQPFRYTAVSKWSTGDPHISADGHSLYFVSDMPGGQGGTDIYRCSRNADGSWSDAVNLGTDINTPGNERSPAVYKDELFFSSDGHIGMGGLDIYKRALNGGKALNLGYPMNSAQDDFAISLTGDSSGFMASNRDKGAGSDDIYSFVLSAEKPAEVLPVTPAPAPLVVVEKRPVSILVENIYYNFDKSNIRNDAAIVLNKIYHLMEQNPESTLFMESHTDSKGSSAYNLWLSKQRAAAAVKYFTERGIASSRIKADGFGQSRPAAPNTFKNGKDNPKGRQLNRRTEIKLTLNL